MRISDRVFFGGLAIVSIGLLSSGLALGEIYRLQPCYWCNFQRFLYISLAGVSLLGVLLPRGRGLWLLLATLLTLAGVYAAGTQSFMQYAPQAVTECGFGDPTLVERWVDWLGGQWPEMFMVTGLCKDKDWVFLGLSLANWSALCFLGLAGIAFWQVVRRA